MTISSLLTPVLKGHAEMPALVDVAVQLGSSVAVDRDPLRLKAMIDSESATPWSPGCASAALRPTYPDEFGSGSR